MALYQVAPTNQNFGARRNLNDGLVNSTVLKLSSRINALACIYRQIQEETSSLDSF